MGITLNEDGTMEDDLFAALGTGLDDSSDEYLTGYADGVADALRNIVPDMLDVCAEIRGTADIMREFLAERKRRNALSSNPEGV